MKIEQKKNGYRIDLRLPFSGRRIRQTLPFKTKQEALAWVEKLKEEDRRIPLNGFNAPKRISIGEAADLYLEERGSRNAKSTQIHDRYSLKMFSTFIGSISVNAISPQNVEAFLNDRKRQNKKVSGINRTLTTLKAFFSWAVERGYVHQSPAKQIKPFRGPTREARPIDPALLKKIWDTLNPQHRLQVSLAGVLGLRASEVANLEWSEIDLENAILRIGASANYTTKSGKSKELGLSEGLLKALLERKASAKPNPWVFPRKDLAGPIHSSVISKAFQDAKKRAGVTGVVFHDLRATAATQASRAGHGDATVGRFLGHSSTAMARKYSNHHSLEVVRTIAENNERWITGCTQTVGSSSFEQGCGQNLGNGI